MRIGWPDRGRLRPALVVALLVATTALAEPGAAQSVRNETRAVVAEIDRLGRESVVVVSRLQEIEASIETLKGRIAQLREQEAKSRAALEARREQHAETMIGLYRVARTPQGVLLLSPQSPVEAVRGGILLRAALGRIEEEAAQLRAELAELARLRGAIDVEMAAHDRATAGLKEARERLATLVDQKATLQRSRTGATAEQAERLASLAAEAKDVRDLLLRIGLVAGPTGAETATRESESDPDNLPGPETNGAASAVRPMIPASGRVIRAFGAAEPNGQRTRGLTIETSPAAPVVAIRAGEIVFAGHFRGYSQLLIIKHHDGYHSLMTGLSRIDAAIGTRVLAGEPVGAMNGAADDRPSLYIELRRHGRPVNPMPWLTASNSKVSG
ncbi:MAG: hypothetical protein FJX67_18315 [Alphaproteobacteria bacterium]|nr:hypothetical protein [Alphaproteobacteria bacterium]